jgi:molybdopterin converting factor small subunit
MMQIHIRLYGPLRDRLPAKTKGRTTLDLVEGATVQDIFQKLNLPQTLLVAINNEHQSTTETRLHDGDRVAFFSPVSGG